MKIVIIGAGSSYTPEFMNGLIERYQEMPVHEICLVDIEDGKEKMEIIRDFSIRMWRAAGHNVLIWGTLDRREALPDADVVVSQFRVGRMYARIKDERIPLLHGMLGQETNGAAEVFNAFRTIPVVGEIIGDMKELCPDAWLINFTNPSGIVTDAIINHFGWKKCIGLCNIPTIAMMREPMRLGKKPEDLRYIFAGINHFHWHKVWDKDGTELTDKVIDFVNDPDGGTPVNIYGSPFDLDFLHSMNLVPCGYHRYYFQTEKMLGHALEEFAGKETRAEKMLEVEEELFKLYSDASLTSAPEMLKKRGGAYYSDTACECINAIFNNKGIHLVVSTTNNGAVPTLKNSDIAEVSCTITRNGAEPMDCDILNESASGLLGLMKSMEHCVIQAALTGDYGMALQAFAVNPLIKHGGDEKDVLNEMLVAHEKYLPQFADVITQLKQQGVCCRDSVVASLCDSGK